MKAFLSAALLVLATPGFTQTAPRQADSACGPPGVRFNVKLDQTQHSLEQPQRGKALVYFLQDVGSASSPGMGAQVTKVGIDGAWVGANTDDSWFSVNIDPGEHHVCVNAQSRLFPGVREFADFIAEAGHVYFFRTRDLMWKTQRLEFGKTNRDQALYMIEHYLLSNSRPNK